MLLRAHHGIFLLAACLLALAPPDAAWGARRRAIEAVGFQLFASPQVNARRASHLWQEARFESQLGVAQRGDKCSFNLPLRWNAANALAMLCWLTGWPKTCSNCLA